MQNNCYWSSQNPYVTHKVLLYPVKVGVWCTVSARIIGPVFFNETINCKRYSQAIPSRVYRRRKTLWLVLAGLCYCPHIYVCLCRFCLMSSGTELAAVVFGQNVQLILILVIFSFWDCLKDKVYNSNPQMEDLKENIHGKITNISAEELQTVNQNLFHTCKECLYLEGQHFQHLL
jgi:hypothetical protein